MFAEPTQQVIRMIERASKIYKHYYGDYPEVVGLDIFSRFKDWQSTNCLDAYHFREVERSLPRAFGPDTMIKFTNVSIKVDPVTFSPVKYNAYRTNPRPLDPKQGENGVWCKRGDHEIAIDLSITKSGYHAVIGEKIDLEAWQQYKEEQGA